MGLKIILFILILFILYFIYKKLLCYSYTNYKEKNNINIDTKFYNVDIFPELKQIDKYKSKIKIELSFLLKNELKEWVNWPEKNLYNNDNIWKIYPLYYYGTWIDKNCSNMFYLTKFLKKLKNMKLAILSVLSPHTVLKEHKGWGSHSNNVLRCHYGLRVPNNCYISVKNDEDLIGTIKPHEEYKWLIFDDSKLHFAANNSDYYRIVLIIDMKRPKYLHKGTSDVGDTKELLDIVKYMRENNIEDNNELNIEKINNQEDSNLLVETNKN